MKNDLPKKDSKPEKSFGYHEGTVESIISVEDVNRQAQEMAETLSQEKISSLTKG